MSYKYYVAQRLKSTKSKAMVAVMLSRHDVMDYHKIVPDTD